MPSLLRPTGSCPSCSCSFVLSEHARNCECQPNPCPCISSSFPLLICNMLVPAQSYYFPPHAPARLCHSPFSVCLRDRNGWEAFGSTHIFPPRPAFNASSSVTHSTPGKVAALVIPPIAPASTIATSPMVAPAPAIATAGCAPSAPAVCAVMILTCQPCHLFAGQ